MKSIVPACLRNLVFSFCIVLGLMLPWCVRADLMTSFQGLTLDANLHLDVPNPGVGKITLDTINQSLLFKGLGADLWDNRNGLPYAWTDIPDVGVGGTWRAETEVKYNVSSHGSGRIAGLTTYAGPDGAGGASARQEFTFGLDQWDDPYGIWVQGLGDNSPGGSSNLKKGLITDVADLRMDVTVGVGNYNTYDFFFKQPSDSDWTSLGTIHYTSTDSRVALFFKGGEMDVSFNYFNVTTVPEPSSMVMFAIFGVILLNRRPNGARRRQVSYLRI